MGNTCRYFKIFTNNNLIILFIVFVFIVYYSFAYPTPDHLNVTPVQPRIRPDITKMNVSQEEYVRMVNVYLRRIHKRSSYQTKELLTFLHSGADHARPDSRNSLIFRTNLTRPQVESATLRMIVEAATANMATTAATGQNIVFRVYERLEGGSRSLVASTSLSTDLLPKWTDIDVQRSTLTGDVKLEIECDSCRMSLSSASLNVLVDNDERTKRQAAHTHTRKTDCYPGMKRKRCCRHTMDVVFKELPGYEFVIQPYVFDAGYCKGACPYRYNPANHHSSLQSLIWRQKKGGAPKPCCAPSKLDKLEILHLDEMDNTKLRVATWSNMMVLECACF